MLQKPKHLAPEYGEQFQDLSIVEAYGHRPPYPSEIFAILTDLINGLPHGDDPRLHWIHGRVEDVALDPPYTLVTAGESLLWMDWTIVLPRFHTLLMPGAYLVIVGHYNMIEALERHGLFQKVGEKMTAPVPFVQSLDDYIESYHSRNGFSRQRMDPAMADAFDQEARKTLLKSYGDGVLSLQVVGTVVWGFPKRL